MNLPNRLTTARIVAVPIFVAVFYLPVSWWNIAAGVVFVLAYLTDILDGHIARTQNMVTDFGKFADPIADKLLTAAALVMLLFKGMVGPIPVLIILAREFLVSGMRLVIAKEGVVLAAKTLGKVKTLCQAVALALVLFKNPIFGAWGIPADQILLWVATALTAWSGAAYLYEFRAYLGGGK